jgi:hypothetical protein
MPKTVTPDQAAAHLRPVDTVGMGLSVSQPAGFVEALGRRDDWEDLRNYCGLLGVPSSEQLLEAALRPPEGDHHLLDRMIAVYANALTPVMSRPTSKV